MDNLTTTMQVVLSNKNYIIKLPTPGQIVEIESLKSQYTDGQYGKMSQNGTILANSALNYVDVVATFSVLIPELKTDLTVKSLFDIEILQMNQLVEEYKKYLSWWLSWIKQMKDSLENKS